MPTVDDFYKSESKYLKAEDLKGRKHPLTISEVTVVEFEARNGKPKQSKLGLKFQGREKGMVLNKTNANTISAIHGADYGTWVGKSISIYPTKVQYGDEMVDSIRVEMPVPEAAADFDDSNIPF